MKRKWTTLLILMICVSLSGCGSTESEDTEEVVSALVVMGQADDAERTNEESLSNIAESDKQDGSAAISNEADPGIATAEEESRLPAYEVTALEEPVLMYATDSLNVRQGPSTDFEIVGFLNFGWEVSVIGQADTGWYEILYNKEKLFVSNEYLQDEKPAPEIAQATESVSDDQSGEEVAAIPVAETENAADIIFVGDSRFVQMKNSAGKNPYTWIAATGQGYKWFNETAVAKIDDCVGNGSKIVINLGVNDLGNAQKYLTLVNTKAEEWTSKGATVYYSSVNPVSEYRYITDEQVTNFNSQLQSGLNENVHWIDSHSYLNSIGYKLVDGLHYNSETYQNLYAYYMSCI